MRGTTDIKDHIVDTPVIGRSYHLVWAKNGCVWNLISINGEECILKTPKTKKEITAKVTDLRNTHKWYLKEKAKQQS